jgi:hypothetical protein
MKTARVDLKSILRAGLVSAAAWALPVTAMADVVTLPVAASVSGVGGVPFVSDVRVFNTSYTDVLSVTAVYRFNGQTRVLTLGPREAMGLDDICGVFFSSPGSLGAVEFASSGAAGQLVVTSQLRSPVSGGGHVGMFVPGLPSTGASVVSVLTGLVNGDSRTNVGVYNPNGVSVTATIRLFDGGVLLGVKSVGLGAHAVTQVNNIYGELGFGSLVRTDGYATVESSDAQSPLFTYAAEADNHTGDLILIVGTADLPAPPGFNPPTATVTPGGPTATPTPTSGAQTVTINVKAWDFAPGGPVSPSLILQAGVTYTLVFHDIDSAMTPNATHGFSGISDLGLPAGDVSRGGPDFVISSFTPQPFQRGTWPFRCTQDNPPCGGDAESHQGMVGILIIQ